MSADSRVGQIACSTSNSKNRGRYGVVVSEHYVVRYGKGRRSYTIRYKDGTRARIVSAHVHFVKNVSPGIAEAAGA